MSIASEITRIKTNIENAYNKAEEKGATIPDVKNSDNLASCIESVSGGGSAYIGVPAYDIVDGVIQENSSIGNVIHDDVITINDSALRSYFDGCTINGIVSFPNLTVIKAYGLYYAFRNCSGITSANFKSLNNIWTFGFYYCFAGNSSLTEADLSSLKSIDANGMNNAFYGCNLNSINLSSLTTVKASGLANAFTNNSNLTDVDFSSLATLNTRGLQKAFSGCTSLAKISFPALTDLGSADSLSDAFFNCAKLTEIHFRSDVREDVEAQSGYSNKFGATNATIYFDL